VPIQQEQLKSDEIAKRNSLKQSKPYVYEKIVKFDEKIKRGESIAIIHLQYDYICNFACEHCSIKRLQGKKTARKITINDVRDLARQADESGLARFVITGGEPLMFKDLDALVEAIDPQKFYINCDTNGWFLDDEKAKHLKSIGIDRIQLSLDSLCAEEHDAFRNKKGSYERAIKAIDSVKKAGLDIYILTVVTKQRLHSEEFIQFIEYLNNKGIAVYANFAKPVGAWEGNFEGLIDKDDLEYMKELEKKYNIFTHLTPAYGIDMGCPAGRNIITISQSGNVFPCQYFQCSLGNIFEETLKDVINRCMKLKVFKKKTCLLAEDREFINKYLVNGVYGKNLPVFYKDLFTDEDFE